MERKIKEKRPLHKKHVLSLSLTEPANAQRGAGPSSAGARSAGSSAGKWRFGLAVSYTLGSKVKFANASAPPLTGKADFTFEDVPSIEIEVRNLKAKSWGFVGAIAADFGRKIKDGNLTNTASGDFIYIVAEKEKFQTTTVLLSAAYRFENFYIPFGINYAAYKITPSGGFVGETKATGGLGGQIGFGNYFTDSFLFELSYRMTAMKWTENVESYENGLLAQTFVTSRFLF